MEGVTERPCIRCQHPLTPDGGQLMYCSHCGAPQIFLSEELQEQAAAEVRQWHERATTAEPAAEEEAAPGTTGRLRRRLRRERAGREDRWPMAVEYALLSGAIALALNLGAMLFAPLWLIAWLWIVSAPILTVGFYNARKRTGPLTAGFAARLGLLTGLLVALCCAVVLTVGLVVSRFALHNTGIDSQIADTLSQIRSTTQAQYGNAAEPMLQLLGIPEFRVGFLLWMSAVTGTIYLLMSTATAGLVGFMLARRRPA